MSSMLEQAIVDAKALKEAAIKNAESAIIDKYQDEVREAMDALLEQEEDEAGQPEANANENMDVEQELSLEAPDAFAAGENLCACPDVDEEITIDFDALRQEMEMGGEDVGAVAPESPGIEMSVGGQDEEDEEIEIVQEELEELVKEMTEELTVDLKPVGSGTFGTNYQETEDAEEIALAGLRDDEAEEEAEEELKAVSDLEDRLGEALSSNKELSVKVEKYEQAVHALKNKLDEVNLSNAKLLYTNRVLSSASLNERQKNKLVEAISSAGSVKEAKVIYETLKNTVGSAPDRRGPQSLREAVTRSSSIMSVRENRRNTADPAAERMQILAGIKK